VDELPCREISNKIKAELRRLHALLKPLMEMFWDLEAMEQKLTEKDTFEV
jgi:hypothetical protein